MKYGTPIHVALTIGEYKTTLKLLKILRNQHESNFSPSDINKTDEDGNTVLHILMRNFNVDPEISSKIARYYLRKGANLTALNSVFLTPLHVGLYYA